MLWLVAAVLLLILGWSSLTSDWSLRLVGRLASRLEIVELPSLYGDLALVAFVAGSLLLIAAWMQGRR